MADTLAKRGGEGEIGLLLLIFYKTNRPLCFKPLVCYTLGLLAIPVRPFWGGPPTTRAGQVLNDFH